jgi:glycine C-acetyltransferase
MSSASARTTTSDSRTTRAWWKPPRRDCASAGFGHRFGARFICGTQDRHKVLERRIADFLGDEDCILDTSCFDANGGLFETLTNDLDVIISDSLNHASIIDGVQALEGRRRRSMDARRLGGT